jgi:Na+-translocating ferredoxin:NAD+ oxidoreductase RnfG subunit
MNEQNQKIMMELTIAELREIQRILIVFSVFEMIYHNKVVENKVTSGLSDKIDSMIGYPFDIKERRWREKAIRQINFDNPKRLEKSLKILDKNYPLPPAYKQ